MDSKKAHLITHLYNSHKEHIVTTNNKEYIKLFEHYNDLTFNIKDNALRIDIMYAYMMLEKFLFNSICSTSKDFYQFAYSDLIELISKKKEIDNTNDN